LRSLKLVSMVPDLQPGRIRQSGWEPAPSSTLQWWLPREELVQPVSALAAWLLLPAPDAALVTEIWALVTGPESGPVMAVAAVEKLPKVPPVPAVARSRCGAAVAALPSPRADGGLPPPAPLAPRFVPGPRARVCARMYVVRALAGECTCTGPPSLEGHHPPCGGLPPPWETPARSCFGRRGPWWLPLQRPPPVAAGRAAKSWSPSPGHPSSWAKGWARVV
jgi:hypothetical protein